VSSEAGPPRIAVVDGTRLALAGEAAAPFIAAAQRHPAATGLILAPLPPRSADLPTVVPVDTGLAAGAARGVLPRSRTGGSLYVIDGETAAAVEGLLGASGLRRAIRELRRRLVPALLATPGAGGRDAAAIGVEPFPAGVPGSPEVPFGGDRPLLLDVATPAADAATLLAALDGGAAGALIRTGDVERDRELLDAVGDASLKPA
jgi:hypothetical protein